MNFKEVAELFSEIANNYPKLDGAHFTIMPASAQGNATGYEIYMTGQTHDDETRKRLNELALKKDLAFMHEATSWRFTRQTQRPEMIGENSSYCS